MSSRSRIHGFTAWANMRLKPFEHSLGNILMDLLRGTNIKYFLESFTGKKNDKFSSFDNLSNEQIHTRVKWMLNELKENQIIANDIILDTRLFAIRSSKHVFDLLWKLVCHDIYFLWIRIDFLSNQNEDILVRVPFKWVPETFAGKNNRKKKEISQLSGFGFIQDILKEDDEQIEVIDDSKKFPGLDYMKSFSMRNIELHKVPNPINCIIEMINIQLRTVPEGEQIIFTKLSELSDTRVLCGLINSFVPNLFPTEILLNDKWCLNLVLRSIDKILSCESTIDSQDLVKADSQSICAFFCYLFMMFYKLKQCRIVINRYKELKTKIKKLEKELDLASSFSPFKKEPKEQLLNQYLNEIEHIKKNYDLKQFFKWIEKVELVKKTIHTVINNKIKLKFDWFVLEEDITCANLCYNHAINLSLTNGIGFYKINDKEMISRNRRIIIRQKNTGKFLNNFSDDSTNVIRKTLRLPNFDPVEIDSKSFPNFDIFVECLSNNKVLKKKTIFMYQVFPSNIIFYHNFLLKACQEKKMSSIQRLIEFFSVYYPNFINLKDKNTQNSALHVCASNGYFGILLYLLENYANVDIRNREGNTPLMLALENFHRDCSKLLIEFGADVNIVNNRALNALNFTNNIEFNLFTEANFKRLSEAIPELKLGNYKALDEFISDHLNAKFPLCTLRSRIIDGSTLLHICSYYGHYALVEKLLMTTDSESKNLCPNIRDYKGATALHRTNDIRIIKLLLDFGANVNIQDLDGNTPLHVRCYGEKNTLADNDAIEFLIRNKAELISKNKKNFLPIHIAAMQGRLDTIKILFKNDPENKMLNYFRKDNDLISSLSPVYIALINNQIECAKWIIKNGLELKKNESNVLFYQILTQKSKLKNPCDVIRFLIEHGCELNSSFENGNSALHYAAALETESDKVIGILIENGAYVNTMNNYLQTPLFIAVKSNNILGAYTLLNFNADIYSRDINGLTAFEQIKEIEEWVKSDFFNTQQKQILKSFEYNQTRMLIRKISHKIKSDFSNKALLNKRKRIISSYLSNNCLAKSISIAPRAIKTSLNLNA